jgi:hypothetical protein
LQESGWKFAKQFAGDEEACRKEVLGEVKEHGSRQLDGVEWPDGSK